MGSSNWTMVPSARMACRGMRCSCMRLVGCEALRNLWPEFVPYAYARMKTTKSGFRWRCALRSDGLYKCASPYYFRAGSSSAKSVGAGSAPFRPRLSGYRVEGSGGTREGCIADCTGGRAAVGGPEPCEIVREMREARRDKTRRNLLHLGQSQLQPIDHRTTGTLARDGLSLRSSCRYDVMTSIRQGSYL